uniref:Uncharacterized protein n=1 Tax=Zooxanthella nutricula TaxID=1333877 RepID=A0A7S2L6R5_9DINO
MIPYWGMLLQTLPAFPFFCSAFSSTMRLPLYFRISHYIFGATFVLCVLPVFSAAAMEFGKRVAAHTEPDGSGAAVRYIGAGVFFASWLCVWAQVVWLIPCKIGVGGMGSYGVEAWHSLMVAVPMNALACFAVAWAFRPQPGGYSELAEADSDVKKPGQVHS